MERGPRFARRRQAPGNSAAFCRFATALSSRTPDLDAPQIGNCLQPGQYRGQHVLVRQVQIQKQTGFIRLEIPPVLDLHDGNANRMLFSPRGEVLRQMRGIQLVVVEARKILPPNSSGAPFVALAVGNRVQRQS